MTKSRSANRRASALHDPAEKAKNRWEMIRGWSKWHVRGSKRKGSRTFLESDLSRGLDSR